MKIGLTELFLIICIFAVAVGPQLAQWIRRAKRSARKAYAKQEKRRAVARIQRQAVCDELLHRFLLAGLFLVLAAAAALVYTLLRRQAG